MNPYPGPRSVLVLDNASIHHSRRFSTMMHAKGFLVLYTPPYCFNLTPLDNGAFGLLKRYLRHHYFQGTMADKMDNGWWVSESFFFPQRKGEAVNSAPGGFMPCKRRQLQRLPRSWALAAASGLGKKVRTFGGS